MFSFKLFKTLFRLGLLAVMYYLVFTKDGSKIAERFIQKNIQSPKNIAFLKNKISKLTGFNVDNVIRFDQSESDSNSEEN